MVLQWLDHFFCRFLGLLELLIARDCFFTPVLIFFAHAVDIVCHEVDRLSERIGASAKDLNGLPHELNIAFCEALISSIFHLVRRRLWLTETAVSGGTLSTTTIALLRTLLLFLSDSAHFNLRAGVFVRCRLIVVVIALIHHGFGLLNKLTLAFVLECRPLLKLLAIIVVLLGRLIVLHVPIPNQLLVALLLLHARLLLIHRSHLGGLFLLLPLPFRLFLLALREIRHGVPLLLPISVQSIPEVL